MACIRGYLRGCLDGFYGLFVVSFVAYIRSYLGVV